MSKHYLLLEFDAPEAAQCVKEQAAQEAGIVAVWLHGDLPGEAHVATARLIATASSDKVSTIGEMITSVATSAMTELGVRGSFGHLPHSHESDAQRMPGRII